VQKTKVLIKPGRKHVREKSLCHVPAPSRTKGSVISSPSPFVTLTLQTWHSNLGASFLLCSPTLDFRGALAVLMAPCQISTTAWCRKAYGCTLLIFHEVPCHVPQSHAAAPGHSNCLITIWLRRSPSKGNIPTIEVLQAFYFSPEADPPVSPPLKGSRSIVPWR